MVYPDNKPWVTKSIKAVPVTILFIRPRYNIEIKWNSRLVKATVAQLARASRKRSERLGSKDFLSDEDRGVLPWAFHALFD